MKAIVRYSDSAGQFTITLVDNDTSIDVTECVRGTIHIHQDLIRFEMELPLSEIYKPTPMTIQAMITSRQNK